MGGFYHVWQIVGRYGAGGRVLALALVAVCAVTSSAEVRLAGWRPSTNCCALASGQGRHGGTALGISGQLKKSEVDFNWSSAPVSFRPNAVYGLSFWIDRTLQGSQVHYGTSFFNYWNKYVLAGWRERKAVMRVPADGATSPVILADRNCRRRTLFDEPRLVELEPRYRTESGVTLGRGEVLAGNRYFFTTQPGCEAGGDTRVLESVRHAATGPCLTLNAGGEAIHRFRVAGRRFLNARGMISPRDAKHAVVEVDASADGRRWTRIATLKDALQCELVFPSALFPAREILLRMRSAATMKDGDFSLIQSVQFEGDVDGAPAFVAGATTYVEKETEAVFLAVDTMKYRVARPGVRLPGSCDGFSVWGASSGFKIFRDTPVPAAAADALCLKAAANEAEAAQLVITPTRAIADLRVEAGPLVAKKWGVFKKGRIPASAVEVLRVGYVDVRIVTDKVGTTGLWPDPLLPQDGDPLAVKAGENQPFWVLVKVPKGTPKGVYRGELKVCADGREVRVPYAVEVFGFELPDRMTLQTNLGFHPRTVYQYHKAETPADRERVREMYLKLLLDHHATPYVPKGDCSPKVRVLHADDPARMSVDIDFSEWDRWMTRIIDEGFGNAIRINPEGLSKGKKKRMLAEFCGVKGDDPRYGKLMREYLRKWVDHLREKGWLEYAFVYTYDEPRVEDFAFVNENMGLIGKYAPELKRMITNVCTEDLMPTVNTWCPKVEGLYVPSEKTCRSRGDNMWWYICCSPPEAPVGEQIDHPGTDMRMWGWQSWGEDVSSILVWAVEWWTGPAGYPDPKKPQDPYADTMGWGKTYEARGKVAAWCNGEGRYLYPPLACRDAQQARTVFDPPVTCYRLEMLRDGVEDYEYLAMLKRADPKSPLLAVPKSAYRDLFDYSHDPADMERRREAVARELERLNGD